MRYAAGWGANLLERARLITPSDAHASFGPAYLYDGDPQLYFQFLTNGADRSIVVFLDQLVFGDFETSTLQGWTESKTGTTSATAETTVGAEVHGGTKALLCTGGDGTAWRYRDVTMRTGERGKVDGWIRSNDGTTLGRVRLQDLQSGLYLQADGSWSAAAADVLTHASTTYTQKAISFQLQGWQSLFVDRITVRLWLGVTQSGSASFDDFLVYPAVNWVSVHGHNVAPVVVSELRSSDNNFASDNLEAALTPRRPVMYSYLAVPVYRPYWKLKLAGTNVATPFLGELFLGYAETVARPPNWGFDTTYLEAQVRESTPAGSVQVKPLSQSRRRAIRLSFDHHNEAEFFEVREELMDRARGGAYPVVLSPVDGEEAAVLCDVDRSFAVTRRFLKPHAHELTFSERPFPVAVR